MFLKHKVKNAAMIEDYKTSQKLVNQFLQTLKKRFQKHTKDNLQRQELNGRAEQL